MIFKLKNKQVGYLPIGCFVGPEQRHTLLVGAAPQ